MAEVFLETERLVLRRFTESDADDLVALDSDPEVLRYLTGGVPIPRAEVLEALRGFVERPELGVRAAEDRDGAFLGWMSLGSSERDRAGTAQLGYRLTRAAWGLGYAAEADPPPLLGQPDRGLRARRRRVRRHPRSAIVRQRLTRVAPSRRRGHP